jgi:hypothetical protein
MDENLGRFYEYVFKPLIHLLPEFDKYNPSDYIIPARMISWIYMTKIAGIMVGIKAFLLLMLGILIFSYRE